MATALPYWIQSTLLVYPALAWMFIGVGLPWVLVALPRKDWRDRILVTGLTLAFAPALVTAWMLVLGTLGAADETPLLRPAPVLAGTGVIALVGIVLMWRKMRLTNPSSDSEPRLPLAGDEKLLVAFIIIAVFIRWWTTAFWPFIGYDPIWVYGYEGRLYTLLGYIPQHIAYYPQFVPLQYTFTQIIAGGVDDHAARTVIFFMHIGAILAVYLLGRRLVNRRTGIIAAALWALYPHVGQWAHIGDLEIPQTFLLTLTAVFFLMAWTGQQPRRRYALLAGLVYGVALWTKPTAGAFVWGVVLLVLLDLFRVRFDWRAWMPRFEVAFLTGLACIPLGGVWYVRNMLLGHNAIDMPPGYWLTQALRSGQEFGWPLLALIILLAYVYLAPLKARPRLLGGLGGLLLVLAGLLPSIIDPHRMGWWEWLLLAAGCGLLIITLTRYSRAHLTDEGRTRVALVGWGLMLAVPYFITWFYSYSYHYRLSFPIVPLLLLPIAVILAQWFSREWLSQWHRSWRWLYLLVIVVLAAPGVVITLYDGDGGWDWLWSDEYPQDFERYRSENPSLTITASVLQQYVRKTGTQPVVIAPGAQVLPFFLPLADIHTEVTPDRLVELEGATHYVYSRHGLWKYREVDILPEDNQIVSALAREDIITPMVDHDDGNFFYELYEVDQVVQRFQEPALSYELEEAVVFGDVIRLASTSLHNNQFQGSQKVLYKIMWEVLDTPADDYMICMQLFDETNGKIWYEWQTPVAEGLHGYYSTRLWEPGERILDLHTMRLKDVDVPPGDTYRLAINICDPEADVYLPVTIDGEPAPQGYIVHVSFQVK
jgi:hypothetical protein